MSLQQQIRERAKALTSLLSIQYPIIGSPMMGVTTPAMVAAVSQAGGLGSLPCGVMTGDAITKAIADVRALTDKPFAVNLRVPPRQEPTAEATQTIFDALEPLRDELGAKHELATIPGFEEQFEAVLAADVPVVSFSFGGPREVYAEALEAKGTIMMGNVNSTREAKVMKVAGCQVIIAQGWEAGGPRQYFENPHEASQIGLMALLPPAVRVAQTVPVVAAGAIMSGQAMVAAMMLGASGVQIGSLLLRSHESALWEAAKAQIAWADDATTRVVDRNTGRMTRVLETGLSQALADAELATSPYPGQLAALASIQEAAAAQNRIDLLEIPLGQGAQGAKALSTAAIMADLVEQYEQLLGE